MTVWEQLAAEFGIVMLDDAIERYRSVGRLNSLEDLRAALMELRSGSDPRR